LSEKKLLDTNCLFSLQLLPATFLILRRNEPDMIQKMYIGLQAKYPFFNTWKMKGQLDATDRIFIAKLIVRSTCFGHHYAHHQELTNYTDGCCLWYMGLWFTRRWSGVEL
jgi:hypothetical protein